MLPIVVSSTTTGPLGAAVVAVADWADATATAKRAVAMIIGSPRQQWYTKAVAVDSPPARHLECFVL